MLHALDNHHTASSLLQHRLASQQQIHSSNTTSRRTDSNKTKEWPLPFIHIINTRFMQHQADLINLARARLVLFETFCLRSILHQSIRQKSQHYAPFLWIIKTDPNLHADVRKEFVSLIEPYPFIYLVASNVNYGIGIHHGGWRGGEAGKDVLQSEIWSGNVTLLQQAHEARKTRAVLETRLDADDGLHVRYIEMIQAQAFQQLRYSARVSPKNRASWMYWCCANHLDWTPTNVTDYGTFVPYKSQNACITAGITLGMSVHQDESSIPRFMHHELYQQLTLNKEHATCGSDTCLHMVENPVLGALRSRTATSAGMRNVKMNIVDKEELSRHTVPIDNKHLIRVLQQGFHVGIDKMKQVNGYMQSHVVEIAADNLLGQCTHGHSCKNSTREALEELVRTAKNDTTKGIR